MSLRINYNLASSVAQRSLSSSQDAYARMAERLSTGLRINKSSDDAAGMAVSERLKNQVRGLNMAGRNAQDGISLIQTAEGALTETHNILARLRELAVQAANDTLNSTDRANLQTEANQLVSEIDRIAASTQFNGISLLDKNSYVSKHNAGDGLQLQIGANLNVGGDNGVDLYVSSARAQDLGDVKVLNLAKASGTQISATGANTFAVGSATGVKYNAEVDTVFDIKDAINAANTGASATGIAASIKNGKLRLEAASSVATKTIGSDTNLVSGVTTATSGMVYGLFGAATGTLVNTVSGSTALEDLGITSSGTLSITAAVAAGDIDATTGAETLAELGVGGSGTLTIGFSDTGGTETRSLAVTYATSDTLAGLASRIQTGISQAAGRTTNGNTTTDSLAVVVGGSNSSHVGLDVTGASPAASIAASALTIDVGQGTGASANKLTTLTDSRGDETVSGTLLRALGIAAIASGGTAQTAATTGATGTAVGGKIRIAAQTETVNISYAKTDSISSLTTAINSAVTAIGNVKDSTKGIVNGTTAVLNGTSDGINLATNDTDVTFSVIASSNSDALANVFFNSLTPAAAAVTGKNVTQDKYRLDSVALVGVTSISSGTGGILDIGTQNAAATAISTVDSAINQVSASRASLGAFQSRLESAARSIAIASENASAANSRIADADIAQSMSELVRSQILQQAGISVLAQANQAPSLVLQLLK